MQTLLAVIDDLWQFAYESLFGFRHPSVAVSKQQIQARLPLTPAIVEPPLFTFTQPNNGNLRSGAQYFIGEEHAYLYSDPVIGFDTALTTIAYGQTVLLQKVGGRWAEVLYQGTNGWILKDVLRERREDIHPQLQPGVQYLAHDSETIKLRACIGDAFGGARAGLPLSGAEYVTYRLSLAKRLIEWPTDGPRIPGTWQKKLRGLPSIHQSINPQTGTIMEYVIDDVGYVAYVDAVFPDKSIKVTAVGAPEEGTYTEEVLTQEEYKELRPVFIEVT